MKTHRTGHSRDHWGSAKLHREKVAKKKERIDGLTDLLATYDADPDSDHTYVLELRAKLRCAVNQKAAMRPVFGE